MGHASAGQPPWTPGYWGWSGGGFLFNDGYGGSSVGFYGGVDYGFGYFGHGYQRGRTVRETTANRISYNGGNGGINARATAQEEAAAHSQHVPPVSAQTQHAWRRATTLSNACRRTTARRRSSQRLAPASPFIRRTCLPSHAQRLHTWVTRSRPAKPAAAGTTHREAEPGSAGAPAETGSGTPAAGETAGECAERPASGATTPAADAAATAATRAADPADAAETATTWHSSRSRRR